MPNEREQIINFLLQSCDAKNAQIQALQAEIAEMKKSKDAKNEANLKS